jgi:regulator of sigma D
MGTEKAENHNDILERTAHQIITETDFRNFVQMMIDVYEAGYLKAYDDCREEFEKHGISLQLTNEVR